MAAGGKVVSQNGCSGGKGSHSMAAGGKVISHNGYSGVRWSQNG